VTPQREQCVTCGDVAVAARVLEVQGREAVVLPEGALTGERVAIDLVPDAIPGERLLCHAGIALERIPERTPA
jgi:hydrogenase maturation factor